MTPPTDPIRPISGLRDTEGVARTGLSHRVARRDREQDAEDGSGSRHRHGHGHDDDGAPHLRWFEGDVSDDAPADAAGIYDDHGRRHHDDDPAPVVRRHFDASA